MNGDSERIIDANKITLEERLHIIGCNKRMLGFITGISLEDVERVGGFVDCECAECTGGK